MNMYMYLADLEINYASVYYMYFKHSPCLLNKTSLGETLNVQHMLGSCAHIHVI